MKIKLALFIFLLLVISVNAQIYTPNNAIQGASTNNNVGIGTISQIGKLDIAVGSTGTFNPTIQSDGSISIGNSSAGSFAPHIAGKSSNSIGLYLHGLTADINTNPDMIFGVRSTTNSDFTTLTTSAFRFLRFTTPLVDILRNGTVCIGTTTPNALVKLDVVGGINTNAFYRLNANTQTNQLFGTGTAFTIGTAADIGLRNDSGKIYVAAGSAVPITAFTSTGVGIGGQTIVLNTFEVKVPTSTATSSSDGVAIHDGAANRLGINIGINTAGEYSYLQAIKGGIGQKNIAINPTGGNVGIGTTNPTSKLTVAGNIASREVKVTVDAGADFVFENNYNLPSLDTVAKYINENKHLPEIASADEMKKEGINLSEMNIKLLQKIEELTLYTIEQKTHTDNLTKVIEALTKRLEVVEQNNLK